MIELKVIISILKLHLSRDASISVIMYFEIQVPNRSKSVLQTNDGTK